MSEKVEGVPDAETASGQNTEGEGGTASVLVPESEEGEKMADQQQSEAVAEKSEASDTIAEKSTGDSDSKEAESTREQVDAGKTEEKTTTESTNEAQPEEANAENVAASNDTSTDASPQGKAEQTSPEVTSQPANDSTAASDPPTGEAKPENAEDKTEETPQKEDVSVSSEENPTTVAEDSPTPDANAVAEDVPDITKETATAAKEPPTAASLEEAPSPVSSDDIPAPTEEIVVPASTEETAGAVSTDETAPPTEEATAPAPTEEIPIPHVTTDSSDAPDSAPTETVAPQENGPTEAAPVDTQVVEQNAKVAATKKPKPPPPKVMPKPKIEPPEVKVDLFVKAHTRFPNKLGDCPFCHRIMTILKLKKIGGTVCPVNLNIRSKEFEDFCAKNGLPMKVPILQHGETVMGDSNAIADYLDKIRPEPNLVCKSKTTNAAGDKIFLKFSAYIKNRIKDNDEKLRAALVDELGRLETFLAGSPGVFLDGDEMKHPDCALLPKLHHVRVAAKYYKKFTIPEELTHVHAYLAAADKQPAFSSTMPASDAIVEGWRKHVS